MFPPCTIISCCTERSAFPCFMLWYLPCICMNGSSIEYLLLGEMSFISNEALLWVVAGQQQLLHQPMSISSNLFFNSKLFLNSCDYPLLGVKGFLALISGDSMLRSSHNLKDIRITIHQGTYFVHIFHPHMECLFQPTDT